jgi:hypothetical protein
MFTQRLTAHRVSIADLIKGRYVAREGASDYLLTQSGLKVSRVNLLGLVMQKFISDDRRYGFLVIDDSSETIRIRCFEPEIELIKKFEVGDLICVIGRVRKFEEEIYIFPEIVRKVEDPNWWIVRKLEIARLRTLGKRLAELRKEKGLEVAEEMVEEEPKQRVLQLIRELDKGEGVELDLIDQKLGIGRGACQGLLAELLAGGEIYEPKPGRYRVAE